MNTVSSKVSAGTLGELLVQLRLLQYGIQAAPPIKDSGNDLIAVNGEEFRAVSVRTTTTGLYTRPPDTRAYHVLAVVMLCGDGRELHLDGSPIFLIPKPEVASAPRRVASLDSYLWSKERVAALFGELPD